MSRSISDSAAATAFPDAGPTLSSLEAALDHMSIDCGSLEMEEASGAPAARREKQRGSGLGGILGINWEVANSTHMTIHMRKRPHICAC